LGRRERTQQKAGGGSEKRSELDHDCDNFVQGGANHWSGGEVQSTGSQAGKAGGRGEAWWIQIEGTLLSSEKKEKSRKASLKMLGNWERHGGNGGRGGVSAVLTKKRKLRKKWRRESKERKGGGPGGEEGVARGGPAKEGTMTPAPPPWGGKAKSPVP